MRKLGMCTAVGLLFSAGSAFAQDYTATLHNAVAGALGNGANTVGATTILVPLGGGGPLDLTVDLTQTAHDHDGTDIAAIQMAFVADAAGVSIVGTVGSRGNTGTGTRYNDPEWASDNTSSFDPNNFSGAMAADAHKGLYGTIYGIFASTGGFGDEAWHTATSTLGHLVINLAAMPFGTIIHLTPTDLGGSNSEFTDVAGASSSLTLQYVPEPASALLLLGALPFMRRRRTA